MENFEKVLTETNVDEVKGFFDEMDFPEKEIASENSTLFYQKLVKFMLGLSDQAENLDLANYREPLAEILCTLSPRERDVLRLRFGMDDGKMRTLEEIAQLFGVKKDEIQYIEAKALRKLRHPNRIRRLREFSGNGVTKSLS